MGIFKKADEKNDDKESAAKKTTKSTEKKESKKESMKDLYSASEKQVKKTDKEKVHGNAYKILVKPLITEKASIEGALGKYTFEVAINTNKVEVAKSFEEVYGIKPTAINVIKMEGKKVRHGKSIGRRKDWKKAIVTLPKGKTINLYEGV
ncbi:MAG: 50S ribosomal protein L23 [Patescibacteria group bacterium]|jgi:large subunit ribosomal protein L23|nr:50S ribosomal protein L23 [Patescibacteria group bacterium]